MKIRYLVWLATQVACGSESGLPSGASESDASVGKESQAVNEAWIGPISEEPPNNAMLCDPPFAVTAATCGGAYCDNNYIFCWPVQQDLGVLLNGAAGAWTPYISEEAPNNSVVCGSPGNITGFMDGMRATGSYSDNISIHCTPFLWNPGVVLGCEWTPYFSEEVQGNVDLYNAWTSYWKPKSVLAGVRCSGKYCDNVSYYQCHNVCTPCDSSAQCGAGFCSNGCCASG